MWPVFGSGDGFSEAKNARAPAPGIPCCVDRFLGAVAPPLRHPDSLNAFWEGLDRPLAELGLAVGLPQVAAKMAFACRATIPECRCFGSMVTRMFTRSRRSTQSCDDTEPVA